MKFRSIILPLCAAVGLSYGTLYAESTVPTIQQAPKSLGQTVLRTVDGKEIQVTLMKDGLKFKGYEEKIVLLEFFGYRCPPCQASIPGYNRLQKKYAEDVAVIAVESWSLDKTQLQTYVKQHAMDYKVVATADSGKIFAFVQRLTGWNPNYGVPFLMLFAPGGKLAQSVPPGGLNEPYVETLIAKIRGE